MKTRAFWTDDVRFYYRDGRGDVLEVDFAALPHLAINPETQIEISFEGDDEHSSNDTQAAGTESAR